MTIAYIGFSHVGIVVPSIERFVRTWGALLDLKDWVRQEVTHEPGIVQHRGEALRERSTSNIAFARFAGTAVELIEPVSGHSKASRWLAEHGPGMNHFGVWVEDLPEALAGLGADVEITYSSTRLVTGLADRAVAATASAPTTAVRPPFWAYVDALPEAGFEVELLDARFAREYRDRYGDTAYYPGDLPDHRTAGGTTRA